MTTQKEPPIRVYCPCCGKWVSDDASTFPEIGPGGYAWTCPECKTQFEISVQFREVT